MKKVILILFSTILMFNLFLPDGLNPSQRESLIRQLQSSDYFERSSAVNEIIINKVYEVLPIIQTDFWYKDLFDKENYLEVMVGLKYKYTKNFIYALYDSIESKVYENIDSVEAKLNLTLLLFKLNDFSKFDYLLYSTNSPLGKRSNYKTINTWRYLLDIQEYEQLAKSTLLRLIEESEYEHDRTRALYWLESKYKEIIIPDLIEVFPALTNTYVKQSIIKDNLKNGNDLIISRFLKEVVLTDTSESIKKTASEYLFKNYNVPSNYLLIKKYIRELKYPKAFNYFVEEGVLGKPYLPKNSKKLEEIIDSTGSYLMQCIKSKWIGKNKFANSLRDHLLIAKTNLVENKLDSSYNNIKFFKDKIKTTYKNTQNKKSQFVTIEGYMFLYWNAQNILDGLDTLKKTTK